MIGATIGAVIVSAIGFAEDSKIGIACVIFYVIYQQVENYVLYPRVMSKSVDIPGAVTVIAALVGRRPARRRRRAAGHPDRRGDPADHPRGVHQAAGRARDGPRRRQLDRDHPGQDQHAAEQLDGARQLVEQHPRPEHAERRTSTSATNDASREPSRRLAAMPAT